MNQCFEFIAENDLQSAGLYSPTHSFHIEWLLNSVPANNTLSRTSLSHTDTHTHTHTMSLLIRRTCTVSLYENAPYPFVQHINRLMPYQVMWKTKGISCTEVHIACTHTKTSPVSLYENAPYQRMQHVPIHTAVPILWKKKGISCRLHAHMPRHENMSTHILTARAEANAHNHVFVCL